MTEDFDSENKVSSDRCVRLFEDFRKLDLVNLGNSMKCNRFVIEPIGFADSATKVEVSFQRRLRTVGRGLGVSIPSSLQNIINDCPRGKKWEVTLREL